jgi:MFS family permease
MLRTTFRSLRGYNYRLWAAGALVSNIGAWMQRTTQDWIVFTELTHHDAAAVGFVMALQFGPTLFLLPFSGYVADHFDRRRVLLVTQSLQGALALGLGILTLSGHVELWHVYVFALMLGCVTAFDGRASPAAWSRASAMSAPGRTSSSCWRCFSWSPPSS